MNLCICILLAVTIFVATHSLKRLFAAAFKREIQQITIIMYTFSICYLLRTAYETYENIRNLNAIKTGDFPDPFFLDMETMTIFLAFVDSPIALILYLHHINSSQKTT